MVILSKLNLPKPNKRTSLQNLNRYLSDETNSNSRFTFCFKHFA